MTRINRKHHIDGLLVLLLFSVFAICILWVLIAGAGTYRKVAQRDDEAYTRRTAIQYVATKVRQADAAGQISVRVFEEQDALVFTEKIDGVSYETRIYCYDGYLRELFAQADADMLPEDGEKVLAASELLLYMDEPMEDQLLVKVRTAEEDWQELSLHLRSGEGAAS